MKQDKRFRLSLITLDIMATRRPLTAVRRFQTLDPHDVVMFCTALGLRSTDASWFDEYMDNPLYLETGKGNC